MFAQALTIFLGAFLLFQVQPLMGKFILPWFGGGPGVWTTCLLFFQFVLLGGYGYAHWSARQLKPRTQAVAHLLLLVAALALLPITPGESWKPRGGGDPTWQILALLTVCLGLPYLVLSATGPLLQHWFSRRHPGASPYRLYALSNTGSLLALVSYPFIVELHLTRKAQASLWGWGFAAYAVLCGFCAVKSWRTSSAQNALATDAGLSAHSTSSTLNSQPTTLNRSLWLLLPACAALLLLAVTNKICQDVGVIPFLWVLPLALYLLSFILCFDHPRWYGRRAFSFALIAALAMMTWVLFRGIDASIRLQIGVLTAGLFVCCMVCHGELYRLKPDPRHLTGFYLMIAAGGALGGLFVAVAAPLIFRDYYELHWGMLLCGLLLAAACCRETHARNTNRWRAPACLLTLLVFGGLDRALAWIGGQHSVMAARRLAAVRLAVWLLLALIVAFWIARRRFGAFRYWRLVSCVWLTLGLAALAAALWIQANTSARNVIAQSRNFYGTLKVLEYRKDEPEWHYLLLEHGRITHGLQFTDAVRARKPTSYYTERSGIALAFATLPTGARKIGVAGLGIGTLAAFARAGDTLRVYEINPAVQLIAGTRFTYLRDCPAKVEIVPGDARLSLEREPPQQFDLLALDAFNSDAVPVHLLTREAFETYSRHLKTNGVIAVHTSNHYLDLDPVVANLARQAGYQVVTVDQDEDDSTAEDEDEPAWWAYASTWMLLTRNEEFANAPALRAAASPPLTNTAHIPLWTDDFASLFQIVRH